MIKYSGNINFKIQNQKHGNEAAANMKTTRIDYLLGLSFKLSSDISGNKTVTKTCIIHIITKQKVHQFLRKGSIFFMKSYSEIKFHLRFCTEVEIILHSKAIKRHGAIPFISNIITSNTK